MDDKNNIIITDGDIRQLNELIVLYRKKIISEHSSELKSGTVGVVIASAVTGFATGGVGLGLVAAALSLYTSISEKQARRKSLEELNRQNSANNSYQNDTGFGSVGQQLTRPLQVLPVVHGSRDLNPNGGVRAGGFLVHNRVYTECGEQRRNSLYVISVGEIGDIDEKNTLIGEQPQDNFFIDEIETVFRSGAEVQTQIDGFFFYSQAVQPQGFNKLGLDFRGRIESAELIEFTDDNVTNVEVVNGNIISTDLPSGYFGITPLIPSTGGTLIFSPNSNVEGGIGLSNLDSDLSPATIEFGFEFFNGQYVVTESGTLQTTPQSFNSSSTFSIVIVPSNLSNVVSYRVNGVEVYTSTISPTSDLFIDVSFNSIGSSFSSVTLNGIPANIEGEPLYLIKLEESPLQTEDPDKYFLSSSPKDYLATCFVGNTPEVQGTADNPPDPILNNCFSFLKITNKDQLTKTILIREYKDLHGLGQLQLLGGEEIYYFNYIRYETTKRVDELELNFVYNLYASYPDNKPRKHGILYDIFIRRTDETLMSHLIRLYTRGNVRKNIFSMLTISNLELGRYYIEIRPVFCDDCLGTYPVYELGDFCITKNIETLYDSGNGIVLVKGEFAEEIIDPLSDEIKSEISWGDPYSPENDKIDISSQQGDLIELRFVNEKVYPTSINDDVDSVTYDNLALIGVYYKLESNEQISFFVNEGIITPNYINAGFAYDTFNSDTLLDINNIFGFGDLEEGYIIKNINTGQESIITSVSSNSITTEDVIEWNECDPYVIYFLQSSAYFPDVFCWFLENALFGVGQSFPFISQFIDWVSIVEARNFCKENNYYYDRAISNEISFAEWAEAESFNSMLFVYQVGGKFALGINEVKPISFVFNASNVAEDDMVISSDDENTIFNRLIVVYSDGRDTFDHDGRARRRPESIIIESKELYDNPDTIIPIEKNLELQSVTNREQALAVGSLYFKLNSKQNTTIQLKTSYEGLNLISGDWVSFNYRLIEKASELSGFVVEIIEDYDPIEKRQVVRLDYCDPSLEQYIDTNLLVGVGMVYKSDGNHIIEDDINVNVLLSSYDDLILELTNLNNGLECLSPLVIGEESIVDFSYRVLSVTPDVNGFVTLDIINVDESMFDFSDLVFIVDDSEIILNL